MPEIKLVFCRCYNERYMSDDQRRLARKYLVYQFLSSLWFIGSIWLYFYRLYITDQQIGLVDGIAFAVGLLANVPAGALADRFGRNKLVRIGQLMAGSGLLLQIIGGHFWLFVTGQSIVMVGLSLISGADEALFFDRLQFDQASPAWRKLVTRGTQAALIGLLFSTLVGGWLQHINPRLPWVLTSVAFIGAALFIWPIKDRQVANERQSFGVEVQAYLHNIKTGFVQFRLPKLWIYVPIILTVQGLFYTTGFGLLRIILLSRFHFSPFQGSVVVASCSLLTVGVLSYMHRHAEQLREKQVITIITLSAMASLLLSLANIGRWGYFVIFILYIGEHILYPFMSEILNKHAPTQQRATVLSVASFLRALPYVMLAPLIGYLNTHKHLNYFLAGWALLMAAAIVIYWLQKRRNTLIPLTQ